MAGWSTTDWAPGNIQAYADEFWQALGSRLSVIGETAPYVPIAGADIQGGNSGTPSAPGSTTGTFSWRWMQDQIENECSHFVQSGDETDGSVWSLTSFNGSEEGWPWDDWTFANLMKAIGGFAVTPTPATNFRRVPSGTSYPSDWTDWNDAAYSYGKIVAGDIMGPWIFQDLQKALNFLIWTVPSYSWTTGTDNYRWGSSGGLRATWAAAKEAAETQAHTTPYPYSNDTMPVNHTSGNTDGSRFDALLERCENQLEATGIYTGGAAGLQHRVAFFVKAEAFGDWYEVGPADLVEDQWKLYDTSALNITATDTSIFIGDCDNVDWCDQPTVGVGSTKGFTLIGMNAIIDWSGDSNYIS